MRATKILFITCLASALLPAVGLAELVAPSQFEEALRGQVALSRKIERDTDRADLPALLSMRAQAVIALDSLVKNGLADVKTIQALQVLAVARKFSMKPFFDSIRTDQSSGAITRLLELSDEIRQSTRLDQDSPSMVTAAVFRQMRGLLESLTQTTVLDVGLQNEIQSLTTSMGKLVGRASAGENLASMQEGLRLQAALEKLLPRLDAIAISNVALGETVATLQGLSAFYAKTIGYGVQAPGGLQ